MTRPLKPTSSEWHASKVLGQALFRFTTTSLSFAWVSKILFFIFKSTLYSQTPLHINSKYLDFILSRFAMGSKHLKEPLTHPSLLYIRQILFGFVFIHSNIRTEDSITARIVALTLLTLGKVLLQKANGVSAKLLNETIQVDGVVELHTIGGRSVGLENVRQVQDGTTVAAIHLQRKVVA